MSDEDKKFAILMALLGTAFGGKGMSVAQIDVYRAHLHEIPIDAVAQAVNTIIKTRKFSSVPTIAEIREAALGRDDEIETGALEAWGKACYAVERGFYSSDPAVTDAVRIAFGGWEKFGQTDPENGVADRAHFIRVFKGLARSRRDRGGLALETARPAALPRGQEIVKQLSEKFGK
ncbi:MAG: hypothetical protein IMZ46_02390 [Acidobacteria bacterium]|nr:hypothetical protein [Acidobacteriota bacterium]